MSNKLGSKRIIAVVVGAIALVMAVVIPVGCVTTVSADEIVVHQDIDGDLTVWTEPGWKYKGLGKTTTYKRSAQLDFSLAVDEKKAKSKDAKAHAAHDNSIDVRFNDNGEAKISGSLSYDLPLDHPTMLKLHKFAGSMDALEDRLVKQTVTRAVYFSGPLMSSRESAGLRRGELIHFIIDQATRGVYKTEQELIEVDDLLAPPIETVEMVSVPDTDEAGKPKLDENDKPLMKKEARKVTKPAKKKVSVVSPIRGKDGKIEVQEQSALAQFGVKMYNLTVNLIVYSPEVKKQIDMQRNAQMDIQTKIAEGKAAEQRRVTVEKEGQANASAAKWKQEVVKAKAITLAQQAKEVAMTKASMRKGVALEDAERNRLVAVKDLEAAKLQKQAKVERAKGDARAKKLILEADGALKQKLEAWTEVQKAWAAALSKQRLVPEIQMGGSAGEPGSAQMSMMQILGLKAARDLQLDMKITK